MKIKIILTFLLWFSFSPFSYAKECKDMVGTYRVIPFIDPIGLTILSSTLISVSPIGTPVFEIKINKNQAAQHIGLIHRKIFPITLKPADKNITTSADILFGQPISSCSYHFMYDNSIIQVDLTKLNQQQLAQALTYITQTWLSRLFDFQKEHNKLIQNNYNIQYYKLDIQSLRQIQYFFIKKHPNHDHINSLIYIIPLQKTTDKAQLTPVQSPLIHQ